MTVQTPSTTELWDAIDQLWSGSGDERVWEAASRALDCLRLRHEQMETELRNGELLLAAVVSTVGGYVAVPKKALIGASPKLLQRQDRPELDLTEFRYA